MTGYLRSCSILAYFVLAALVSGQESKPDRVTGSYGFVPKPGDTGTLYIYGYLPELGETAALCGCGPFDPEPDPPTWAWTSAEALSRYCFQLERELRRLGWVADPGSNGTPPTKELLAPMLEEQARQGDRIKLAHSTKVKVLAYGTFSAIRDARLRSLVPDRKPYTPHFTQYFVEILDGPQKGRNVWVERANVAASNSKHFETHASAATKPAASNSARPAKPQSGGLKE
jgi:hypothetical protein